MAVLPCPVCGWTMNLKGWCANCGYDSMHTKVFSYDNKVEGDKE